MALGVGTQGGLRSSRLFVRSCQERRSPGQELAVCGQAQPGKPRAAAKLEELKGLEPKTTPRGPEGGRTDAGEKGRARCGRRSSNGFETNARGRSGCRQHVGLSTWCAGGPARTEGRGSGWIPGSFMHWQAKKRGVVSARWAEGRARTRVSGETQLSTASAL